MSGKKKTETKKYIFFQEIKNCNRSYEAKWRMFTHRNNNTRTHIHIYNGTSNYGCKHIYIYIYIEREREIDREGGKKRDLYIYSNRQTDRQTHTHTHTHTHIYIYIYIYGEKCIREKFVRKLLIAITAEKVYNQEKIYCYKVKQTITSSFRWFVRSSVEKLRKEANPLWL